MVLDASALRTARESHEMTLCEALSEEQMLAHKASTKIETQPAATMGGLIEW